MSPQSSVKASNFTSDGNLMAAMFAKMLGEATFIELVKVEAVNGETCDVRPLVASRSPNGAKIPTTVIEQIPFFQLQMGTSAIKIIPKIGDIGLMLCCDRDISNVVATKSESMVGAGFTHSRQDGIYLGGIALLNAAPTEYIEFTGSGINIVAPNGLHITGSITMSSTLDVTGATSIQGTDFKTHTHSGVQSGGSNTGGVN